MRCIVLAIFLLFSSIASVSARAEDAASLAAEPQHPQAVSIIEDQDAKAFRFMIDGHEVARLDATGLHIRESIEYGGSITDAGVTVLVNPLTGDAP